MTSAVDRTRTLIQELASLAKQLPKDIAEATKSEPVFEVLQKVSGETTWETFNRRFDILFGENRRGPDGRLMNIRRGRYGMQNVVTYLNNIVGQPGMLYELMDIKLNRIIAELDYLISKEKGATGTSATAPDTPTERTVSVPTPSSTAAPTTSASKSGEKAPAEASVPSRTPYLTAYLDGVTTGDLPGDNRKDKTYQGRGRDLSESPVPDYRLDSDGLELIEDLSEREPSDNEAPRPREGKRKRASTIRSESAGASANDTDRQREGSGAKKAAQKNTLSNSKRKPPKKHKSSEKSRHVDRNSDEASSEAQSDGNSALREVEARQAKA
ncbi:hypothetical protein FA95DRAFT_1599976 [Auriscalpium vulgare]|uniref:Uncharacterized protein n=1 Tax=Auriscalpium vulgare TaxID=40419 RepID=A0ACB8R4D2_9AGAM|nr:hypothetical protein FA95DRAFT_1599976 [Auriscalpium vulgare]